MILLTFAVAHLHCTLCVSASSHRATIMQKLKDQAATLLLCKAVVT